MDRNDLDRHITGNGGEDFLIEHPEAGPTTALEAAAVAVHIVTCEASDFDLACQTKYDEVDMRIARAAVTAYLDHIKLTGGE